MKSLSVPKGLQRIEEGSYESLPSDTRSHSIPGGEKVG